MQKRDLSSSEAQIFSTDLPRKVVAVATPPCIDAAAQ
jgi:hypothetical protein